MSRRCASPRSRGPRGVVLCAGLCAIAVLALGACARSSSPALLAHLGPVRALRCAGAPHPALPDGARHWRLRYARISGDTVRAVEIDSLGGVRRVSLAASSGAAAEEASVVGLPQARALATAVEASGLACTAEMPRADRRTDGAWRRSVRIEADGGRQAYTLDPCHTVSDPAAFALAEAALSAYLGGEAGSPPSGAPLGAACDDATLGRTRALDDLEARLDARPLTVPVAPVAGPAAAPGARP